MEFKMDDREAMAWQMLQRLVNRGALTEPLHAHSMFAATAYRLTDVFIAETQAQRNEGQR